MKFSLKLLKYHRQRYIARVEVKPHLFLTLTLDETVW